MSKFYKGLIICLLYTSLTGISQMVTFQTIRPKITLILGQKLVTLSLIRVREPRLKIRNTSQMTPKSKTMKKTLWREM